MALMGKQIAARGGGDAQLANAQQSKILQAVRVLVATQATCDGDNKFDGLRSKIPRSSHRTIYPLHSFRYYLVIPSIWSEDSLKGQKGELRPFHLQLRSELFLRSVVGNFGTSHPNVAH
eukprot:1153702-Pleurochrysis_carterae.AAC.2